MLNSITKSRAISFESLIQNSWYKRARMTVKNMARSIDDYFAFNRAALTVKNERLELIRNIANASTLWF